MKSLKAQISFRVVAHELEQRKCVYIPLIFYSVSSESVSESNEWKCLNVNVAQTEYYIWNVNMGNSLIDSLNYFHSI